MSQSLSSTQNQAPSEVIRDAQKPLIVQGNMTVLLDVHADGADSAREAIMPFAELEKSPEHIHTYKISPLSLWNAASAGIKPANVVNTMFHYSRYELPSGMKDKIVDIMGRFGKIQLLDYDNDIIYLRENQSNVPLSVDDKREVKSNALARSLFLKVPDLTLQAQILKAHSLEKLLTPCDGGFQVALKNRGTVKWELIKLGFPCQDLAPLRQGEFLDVNLRYGTAASGEPFKIRDYQDAAVDSVLGNGGPGAGYGVVALPCGSGKTIVGLATMAKLKCNTLILTANTTSVHQWITEILDKTTLVEADVAEYTGAKKNIAPVTVATYQILTYRGNRGMKAKLEKNAGDDGGDGIDESGLIVPGAIAPGAADSGDAAEHNFPHFDLFRARPWGLIIYDEVHLLPAPIFRVTAELQAVRRLGLTATLVREDGEENSVFSLVGPKRYDVPWKELENRGWIAEARCIEVRIKMPPALELQYVVSEKREKFRIAAENPLKLDVVKELLLKHSTDYIMIIGAYIDQLQMIAREINAPLITGKTSNKKREEIYGKFREGELRIIVVSKVANFAIDLPDASCAIEVSGAFGSRQEEAQRLGRILRPKENGAYFYTLVSHYTVEEEFSSNRQKFLLEQGYKYSLEMWEVDSQDE